MCGRFTLTTPADRVAEAFGLGGVPDLAPRYNVAPNQAVATVGLTPGGRRRRVAMLRWGYLPRWAKDPKTGPRPINLRSEMLGVTFGFEKRCLVPADGFYEWAGTTLTRRPFRFTMKSGGPFAIAGVWESWGQGRMRVRSCAVLTTDANGLVLACRDRMPVILPREAYDEWLAPATPLERLTALTVPYSAYEMRVAPANKRVDNPNYDYPDCLTAPARPSAAGTSSA